MKRRRPGLLSLVTLLTTAVLSACSGQTSETPAAEAEPTPLPLTIHGMLRVDVLAGQEAADMLERMHGEEVAPLASYVGRYRSELGSATLYLSRFTTPEGADTLLTEMSESIGEGSGEFGHHARFDVAGQPVHMVLGQDQVHFFFARDRDLIWLGIDPALARPGLADVLGLPEEDVAAALTANRPSETPSDPASHGGSAGAAPSDPGGGR